MHYVYIYNLKLLTKIQSFTKLNRSELSQYQRVYLSVYWIDFERF